MVFKMVSIKPALPVVIAGGGIGGIAAALALVRVAMKSSFLKRHLKSGKSMLEYMQLDPNAFHAFDALDIDEKAHGRTVYTRYMVPMPGKVIESGKIALQVNNQIQQNSNVSYLIWNIREISADHGVKPGFLLAMTKKLHWSTFRSLSQGRCIEKNTDQSRC